MFNPKIKSLWLIVVASIAVVVVVAVGTSCAAAVYGCNTIVMTQCLSPLKLPVDGESGKFRIVPCGKCNACLVRSRSEWVCRLQEEARVAKSSYFLTLTYDNEHLPIQEYVDPESGACFYNGVVVKDDIVKFNKRFRKYLDVHFGAKTRYYLISEYGPHTLRPHYHGIYCLDTSLSPDDVHRAACSAWPFCDPLRLTVGLVTTERIRYVTEYCLTKDGIPSYLAPNFRLMSRNPGIGSAYVNRMKSWHLADDSRFYIRTREGDQASLPRYYREKIYNKETLSERSADIEAAKLQELISVTSAPGFDPVKYELDKQAAIADYKRKTAFLLNKKLKKI